MEIWTQQEITLELLNQQRKDTLAAVLDIRFTGKTSNSLEARMPVNKTTHQPYGLLHGGASAALAETVGSVASWLCIDPEKQMCVGMEINCNHLRPKREGMVTATCSPLHLGATSHVWDIRITDEREKLICVSRLTVAIIKRKQ